MKFSGKNYPVIFSNAHLNIYLYKSVSQKLKCKSQRALKTYTKNPLP